MHFERTRKSAFRRSLGRRLHRPRLGGRLGAAGQEFGDPHDGQILLVAALAPRILAAALLERDDFRAASVRDDRAGNRRAGDQRRADMARLSVKEREDFLESHDVAGLAGSLITVISSSAATLYCLPPVLITANIVFSVFNPALRLKRRGRLLCSIDPLVDCPARPRRGVKTKSAAESRAGARRPIGTSRGSVNRIDRSSRRDAGSDRTLKLISPQPVLRLRSGGAAWALTRVCE